MQDQFARNKPKHRTFGLLAWAGRSLGWLLIIVAILGAVQSQFLPAKFLSFSMVSSLILGLVAMVWITALELFLRFFGRYLARN